MCSNEFKVFDKVSVMGTAYVPSKDFKENFRKECFELLEKRYLKLQEEATLICNEIGGQMEKAWIVQIKGEKCSNSFEISVVRSSNEHGRQSWGWFDEDKLLICHNGGPCDWALVPIVWDKMVEVASDVCEHLNTGGSICKL